MTVEYTSASPVGEAFTSKKGTALRRWLLVSGRDMVAVLASATWAPKLVKTQEGQLGVAEIGGLRFEGGLASGFVRENR